MSIKLKYVIPSLVIIFVIVGVAIWLIGGNDKSADDGFNNGFAKTLSACQKAAPSYIGLHESQASDKARTESFSYRVVSRDGKGLEVTLDYGAGRLNFDVNKDVVTRVTCG